MSLPMYAGYAAAIVEGRLSAELAARGVVGNQAQPLICCATRGRVPINAGSAATTNNVRAETRRSENFGSTDQSEIRAVFSGYYVDATTGQETACGNAVTIEAAIECNGVTVPFTFDGAATGTIPNGAAEYVSDPLYPWMFGLSKFPAGAQFWWRERRDVIAGQRFVRHGSVQSQAGEGTFLSNGASPSQVSATGVMTQQASGSTIACCFAPTLLIGRSVGRAATAWAGVGDSIMQGSNAPYFGGASDGSADNGGWFTDALYNVNGMKHAHCLLAQNSTYASQTIEAPSLSTAFTKRRALFKYFTHAIENYGTNDIGSGAQTGAATYVRRQKIWGALKSGDSAIRKVYAVTILPRTDSTDGWTTNNQTPRTGYTTSAARDVVNAGILTSLAVGEINGIFDLNALFAEGNVWKRPTGSRTVADGAIASGTRNLTSATAAFTAADVGKSVTIAGAGAAGALLCGSIVSITNATTVVCNFINTSTNATTTVSGAAVNIGGALTDDGTHPNMAAANLARDAFRALAA